MNLEDDSELIYSKHRLPKMYGSWNYSVDFAIADQSFTEMYIYITGIIRDDNTNQFFISNYFKIMILQDIYKYISINEIDPQSKIYVLFGNPSESELNLFSKLIYDDLFPVDFSECVVTKEIIPRDKRKEWKVKEFESTLKLSHDSVVVGGTFDHLHLGHRLLLSAASLCAQKQIRVGITSEALLMDKKYKQKLESFEKRKESVDEFLRIICNESVSIVYTELMKPEGVLLSRDVHVDALVVSKETEADASQILQKRLQIDMHPVELIVIDILSKPNLHSKNSASNLSNKLSSTSIREHLP
uniref:Cytidyltransferase-like domain-containing protein n=1 Tax=Timspurckia oligopyrenoides TaxID=708627 RepID=A0A7S0ZI56_9RHOD